MSKTSKQPATLMPTSGEDKAITAKQLKAMVPLRALPGRPKSENKKLLVSVRYIPEVVEYFKSTGEG